MSSGLPKHLLAKTFALTALALGVKSACALDINMVNMQFDAEYNASGNIDFDNGTGSFSSLDPFFGHNWTATVIQVFTGPGSFTWSDSGGPTNTANDNVPIGNYNHQFTLQAGQVAAGTFFDWNNNNDIPVLSILDCNTPDSGCIAAGPDNANGVGGVKMQSGPFVGSGPAFNSGAISISVPPIVLARNVSGVNVQPSQSVNWNPDLNGSATPSCTITASQQPAQGVATIQSDCSSGTYTAGAAAGTDVFSYTVTSTGGSDTATVDVVVSAVTPPTAVPDTAATSAATAVTVDVLSNDSDADGTLIPGSVAVSSPPAQGTTSVNAATGAITYQPNTGFCGTDRLSYTVDDNDSQTSQAAIVTVDVSSNALCSSDNVTLTAGPSDPDNDGHVTLSELISAGIPSDGGVTSQCIGGCFDYQLTGLAGPIATVIMPLSAPIPALAKLRKWDGSAWTDFVEGANDSVATAASVAGVCPGSGYTPSLTRDDDCLRLIISDGGPNDQDKVTNGTIVDPVGVGNQTLSSATTDLNDAFGSVGGSGCVITKTNGSVLHRFDWAVLLGFVTWLGFGRKKRKL